jgi:capsular exopolysaccharide synthesis family protein
MEKQHLRRLLLRWLWLFLLAGLLAGAISFLMERRNPALYVTTTRLIVGPGIDSPSPNLNDLRAGSQLMQTYAELPKTTPFLRSVIDDLGLDLTPQDLGKMITVRTNEDTQLLSVEVQAPQPQTATAIANSVANTLVRYSPSGGETTAGLLRQQIQRQAELLEASIPVITARVEELEIALANTSELETQQMLAEQLSSERNRLDDRHRTLATLYETLQTAATNQVKIIEPASAPTLVASRLWLAIVIGALTGVTLSALLVFAYEYSVDSVDTAEEMQEATGVPTLGSIARHGALKGSPQQRMVVRAEPASTAAEDYRMLAIKLLFARQGGQPLRSILLTSVEEGQDVGEIAANVAVVLAQTGSRVVLVDGNLQRPTIGHLFGFNDRCGLTDVLTGECSTADPSAVHWAPGLLVLPSGSVTYNAFTLLASPRMVEVLEQLEARADLVLITASPLTSSADSLFLASRVDGVILAAQGRQVRRRMLRNAVASLEAVGARVLGTILQESGRPGRRNQGRGLREEFIEVEDATTIPSREQIAGALAAGMADDERPLDSFAS